MRGSSSGSRHISKRIRFRQGWRVLLRIGHGQAPQGQAKACPTGIALGHVPTRGSGAQRTRSRLWETEPIPPLTRRSRPFGLPAPARHKRWVAVKLRFSLRKPPLYSAAMNLSVDPRNIWPPMNTDEHGAAEPQPNLRSVALLIKMFVIEADILKRSATL